MNLDAFSDIIFNASKNYTFRNVTALNNEVTLVGDFPGYNKTNLHVYVENEDTLILSSTRTNPPITIDSFDITGYEVKKVSIVDGVLSVVLTKYAPDKNRVKIDITD